MNGLTGENVGGFHPGSRQRGMRVNRVGKFRGGQFRANRHCRFRDQVRGVDIRWEAMVSLWFDCFQAGRARYLGERNAASPVAVGGDKKSPIDVSY